MEAKDGLDSRGQNVTYSQDLPEDMAIAKIVSLMNRKIRYVTCDLKSWSYCHYKLLFYHISH